MADFEIDPVKYGQLWEKVDHLTAKVDKLEEGMEELLALANKGRGGFWVGMMIVSGVSTFIGYLTHFFASKS
jgi:exosome complex RNA-binding protein Rrp4